MSSPLLSTKFHLPPLRSSLVKRARLIEHLNQGVESSKLILLSAPAGFGKTTLLSEWLHQVKISRSWLSLDPEDNDLARFWIYFVGALQQVDNKIGAATLSILRSNESSCSQAFLIPLINEIAQLQADFVLVLDDYHVIVADPIHYAVNFLLEHLPSQFHLAIASRTDPPLPLARLRVQGQLTEVRTPDLRFTLAEAATFLDRMAKLPLSVEQVKTITVRTEGWIAGLQLAALSLRDTQDISICIDSLGGNQRYILDYLVAEVLERQPQCLQHFLLRTSILNSMCNSLCQAVLGADPVVAAGETLEQLEQQNLFVVPLDHERRWYRYHHLFREVLCHHLHRVEPEQIPEYHRRAAHWYEQQGLVAEAIEQAIAACEFDWAAAMIERQIQKTTNPPVDSAAMLLKWLEALPEKLVLTSPWLSLAYAWTLFSGSQFAAAAVAVQNIERLLQQQEIDAKNTKILFGVVTLMKGLQARHRGEVSVSLTLLEQALQLLPQGNSWLRASIVLNLGVTYFVADNFESAKPVLREATRIGQVQGYADAAIASLYLQAQFLALRGQMEQATALCQQGVDLARKRGWLATYAGVLVQVAMGELLREQNQLEAAKQHLDESIQWGTQAQQPGLMMSYITLARVLQAQADFPGAWAAIRAAQQCQLWLWPTILSVEACLARLNLAEGNLEAAIAWAESSGLGVEDELRYSSTQQHPHSSELNYLTLARVLIACGQLAPSYLEDAQRLLLRLQNFAQTGQRSARVMETLLLQALLWQVQDKMDRALSLLEQALKIPRTGAYIRLFVDEGEPMAKLLRYSLKRGSQPQAVRSLLANFELDSRETSTAMQPLVEPLSAREIEILQHLATGISNQALADQLFVSLATVKWHARNIYSKLNVGNRTQAVKRARELGLLD